MSTDLHGTPCWFELGTTDLSAASAFYGQIFGWAVADSGMPEMTYHLARDGDAMVAGMMPVMGPDGTPPYWMVYISVSDIERTVADAQTAGGSLLVEVQAVPGTGRFAILADPGGAALGVLESEPMETPPNPDDSAWNQNKAGRGNWLELMHPNPEAAFDFYAGLFGWTKGDAMETDGMGPYQLFAQRGVNIGGMMGLADGPVANWLPYFGVDKPVSDVIAAIKEAGGSVTAGPMEVPGPAWVAVAQDPQGAWFALVGAER